MTTLNNATAGSILGSLILISTVVVILTLKKKYETAKVDSFDATGLVYNVYPEWFMKSTYDPADWLVTTYPDSINASCMPYKRSDKFGSLENINYYGSAMRFWRF